MSKIETPLVSVIIPVYNLEDKISRCIKSLQRQDEKSIELIFVDDGSSDRSLEILKTAQQKDARIRVFENAHGGVSKARNTGLEESRGKYVCFVDGDDYVKERYVSSLLDEAEKTRASFVCAGFTIVKQNTPQGTYKIRTIDYPSNTIDLCNCKKYKTLDDAQIVYRSLKSGCYAKLFLNELIKKKSILFPEWREGEDLQFNALYFQAILEDVHGIISYIQNDEYRYVRYPSKGISYKYDDGINSIKYDIQQFQECFSLDEQIYSAFFDNEKQFREFLAPHFHDQLYSNTLECEFRAGSVEEKRAMLHLLFSDSWIKDKMDEYGMPEWHLIGFKEFYLRNPEKLTTRLAGIGMIQKIKRIMENSSVMGGLIYKLVKAIKNDNS